MKALLAVMLLAGLSFAQDAAELDGSSSSDMQRNLGSGLVVNRWPGVCQKMKAFSTAGGDMKPGADVTEKVKQALARSKP
ncbi:MAG: hypothetical protein WCB56_17845 [Terriglobales bacterium]|jgi:hypothetical protein